MPGELTGKLIADKYRVDAFLGPAGLGELYRGTNTLLDKPVSISILTGGNGSAQSFFAEAKTAAKVNHPNVLSLVDFGTYDGTSYAVFEAAGGETLAEALRREQRLPVDMSVAIARQIASGLDAAHATRSDAQGPTSNIPSLGSHQNLGPWTSGPGTAGGVIHGNLNPANIVVASTSPDEVAVKIFGFGTANAIDEGTPDPSRFAYLAPEQCSGGEMPDARGDIYSAGAILFEMLAGEPPFRGETPTEVMTRHVDEPPPPLSAFRDDLPPELEPVILKAMAKDPEARYRTAGEFAADLDLAMTGQPTAVAAAADAGEGTNNIWKTAFVVLVGISLLTIGLIYATSVKQTDPATAVQSDANGMPVQPINPATGVEEQNLSNLPPDYTMLGNSNINPALGDSVPGDASNPWLNGNMPPAGAPAIPPGGQVVQVPPGQSPFMMDPNCIPQPSGIYLCPVPVTPTPAPRATASPRNANANTNSAAPPAATPTPQARPTATPARSPANPARTPAPANNRPAPTGDQS